MFCSLFIAILAAQTAPAVIQVPADYPTMQLAINAAAGGDTILVAPGTYAESILIDGKDLTILSSGGPIVTTIDGSALPMSVVIFQSSGLLPDCTMEGFTITGGDSVIGGGVLSDVNLTLTNCILTNNKADYGGGLGAIGIDSTNVIQDCTFLDNEAIFEGGGLYLDGSANAEDFTLTGTLFRDNLAANGGGAYLHRTTGNILVARCTFFDNEAFNYGGALRQAGGNGPIGTTRQVRDCVFAKNQAGTLGGAIYNDHADDVLINNTFYANEAGLRGGAMKCTGGFGTTEVRNSILWDNEASLSGAQIEGTVTLNHNLVQGINPGIGSGTLNQAPRFRNANANDFRLRAGSPCIDAGFNSVLDGSTDALGLTRKTDDPGSADTGVGTAPIIDLGAIEFQGDSTGFVPRVVLNSAPLQAGQFASLQAQAMRPGEATWLFASSQGTSLTNVPALQVYLDLTAPRSYFTGRPADASGTVTWDFTMPPGATGRTINFQSAQFQLKTDLLTLTVL